MFYHVFFPLAQEYSIFNVFRYVTFRTAYAALTALLICLVVAPRLIRFLQQRQIGQVIREEGPQSHFSKAGTPTMGGMLILGAMLVSTLLWANLSAFTVWIVLLSTLAFGAVGFWDDYLKLARQHNRGFLAKYKFSVEIVLALIVVSLWCVWAQPESVATRLSVPFFKSVAPNLGLLGYIPIGVLVIVGTSNAVNLTDGLDGLAVGPVIIATFVYAGIAYVAGHVVFSNYLNILYVRGAGEVAVFCGALFGACLGFLWFNAYPAQVFMGDVGSLALGGALGTIAVVAKHELLLLVIGGLFVIETLSVMIQVASFKLTGKRVFRMAPLHHHFEQKGWQEPKVIVRFWIIAIVLALISLSTLKLR
ncbi:phospho-N-acetylmuramoyl-pentapeptide-transferase [Candidatus Entotheonella palauensis]|uniref:phospho-N-acetylmuramoyl-pentapeptide- transferase n=1 Tax=Candidatus Entotheonella palauensis TaxID=93172 RepID=UPI000B7D0995|nr:phospho-N-acetylmuramoyl-pentapeptide-transferase [Candidatus Entotheonella palauensis]